MKLQFDFNSGCTFCNLEYISKSFNKNIEAYVIFLKYGGGERSLK